MEVVKKLFESRQRVNTNTQVYMETILNIALLSMVATVMIESLYHLY
jgi:hypothetical protein